MLGDETIEMNIPLTHNIEERTLDEIKAYYKPKVFIEYCKACQYYNKIWTCPPYNFDITKMLEIYQYAYIIGSKVYIKDLGEDFKYLLDKDDLGYVANEIYKFTREVIDEKIIDIGLRKKHICVLLAGRCLVCDTCTREKQLSCIYPDKMQLSLESIGFDVSSICEDILGYKMQWATESLPEYFVLVSTILSREKLCVDYLYNSITLKTDV